MTIEEINQKQAEENRLSDLARAAEKERQAKESLPDPVLVAYRQRRREQAMQPRSKTSGIGRLFGGIDANRV